MSLRLPRDTSPDQRHAAWIRVVERIHDEQITQGWRHRTFRLFRAVFNNNTALSASGGFLFNWMAENYLDAALMVVRRELDVQDGTENLRNLLEDIIDHPEVLTRARYLGQWKRDTDFLANRAFDSFGPASGGSSRADDYIAPAAVRADLDRVVADNERLRVYAERTRAHRSPEQRIDRSITFRDLHQTIADVRVVVGKYYALLTLSTVMQWEPVAQYDTLEAFSSVWMTDADAVSRETDGEE